MGCGSSKRDAVGPADPADVEVVVAGSARFYTSTIVPPTDGFDFSASLSAMHRGEAPSAHARDSYLECWADNPQPWRWGCREGMPPVEDADAIAREEAAKMKAESDDAGSLSAGTHGELLRGFGVRVKWLLGFTETHDCWGCLLYTSPSPRDS